MKYVIVKNKNGLRINPATEDTLSMIERMLEIDLDLYVTRNGYKFLASDITTGVANGDYVYYLIIPDSNTPLVVRNLHVNAEGDLRIDLYVNPTITDNGDEINVYNAYDSHPNTNKFKVYKYPSWSDMGTLIEVVYIPGTGTRAVPLDIFKNRIITLPYLLSIKNVSGNNLQYLDLILTTYEGVI